MFKYDISPSHKLLVIIFSLVCLASQPLKSVWAENHQPNRINQSQFKNKIVQVNSNPTDFHRMSQTSILKVTPTPQDTPPPISANIKNGMLVLGTISIITVLVGLWINREKFTNLIRKDKLN